jgi:hypothetical protein
MCLMCLSDRLHLCPLGQWDLYHQDRLRPLGLLAPLRLVQSVPFQMDQSRLLVL